MNYGDEVLGKLWGGKNAPTELNAARRASRSPTSSGRTRCPARSRRPRPTGSEPYTIPPEKRPVAEIVGNYAVRDDAVAAEAAAERHRIPTTIPEDDARSR